MKKITMAEIMARSRAKNPDRFKGNDSIRKEMRSHKHHELSNKEKMEYQHRYKRAYND